MILCSFSLSFYNRIHLREGEMIDCRLVDPTHTHTHTRTRIHKHTQTQSTAGDDVDDNANECSGAVGARLCCVFASIVAAMPSPLLHHHRPGRRRHGESSCPCAGPDDDELAMFRSSVFDKRGSHVCHCGRIHPIPCPSLCCDARVVVAARWSDGLLLVKMFLVFMLFSRAPATASCFELWRAC